jgi:hypothetical protein
MRINRGGEPPNPPATFRQLAEEFGMPAFCLAAQPHLEPFGAGAFRRDGQLAMLSVNYVYVANPSDREGPGDVASSVGVGDAGEKPFRVSRPHWIRELGDMATFPLLPEAVRTWSETESSLRGFDLLRMAGEHLEHTTLNRIDRLVGEMPPPVPESTLAGRETEILLDDHSIVVSVVESRELFALATSAGGRALTCVLPRDLLVDVELAFLSSPPA